MYTDFQITRLPSEIFEDHMYLTFMDDEVGGHALDYWGDRNCMWSSDYPHPVSSWPKSRAIVEDLLEGFPDADRAAITHGNAERIDEAPEQLFRFSAIEGNEANGLVP